MSTLPLSEERFVDRSPSSEFSSDYANGTIDGPTSLPDSPACKHVSKSDDGHRSSLNLSKIPAGFYIPPHRQSSARGPTDYDLTTDAASSGAKIRDIGRHKGIDQICKSTTMIKEKVFEQQKSVDGDVKPCASPTEKTKRSRRIVQAQRSDQKDVKETPLLHPDAALSMHSLHLHHMNISQAVRSMSNESSKGSQYPTRNFKASFSSEAKSDICDPECTLAAGQRHDCRIPRRPLDKSCSSYGSDIAVKPTAELEAVSYDGSGEANPQNTRSFLGRPATMSAHDNHQQTAELWEKAFNGFQDSRHTAEINPRRLSHFPLKSSLIRRRVSSVAETDLLGRSKTSERRPSANIHFKPLRTEFTIDKLDVPRHDSSAAKQLTPHSFDRQFRMQDSRMSSYRKQSLLSIAPDKHTADSVVTTSTRERSPQAPPNPHSLRGPLESWSRYPSHTRAQRNGSAGILDQVYTRDFAVPCLPSPDEPAREKDGNADPRKRVSRMRNLLLRRKFKTDVPDFFSTRSTNFRRPHRGHRTSVSTGGALEYPELELLPAVGAPAALVATDLGEPLMAAGVVGRGRRPVDGE